MLRSDCEWFPNHNVECKVMAELRCFLNGDLPCGTYGSALFLSGCELIRVTTSAAITSDPQVSLEAVNSKRALPPTIRWLI